MRVALAGPMGAGKSTVGRLLAARWGVPFVDLDARVGDAAAIFAAEGETGFRARERAALAEAVTGEGVLALGGGTVVDPGNRALLAGWRVFVLTAPAATLRARVGEGTGRPLASRLEALIAERASAYAAAGEPVDTDGRTPNEVAAAVEAMCAST
jgi:shikimate kinase